MPNRLLFGAIPIYGLLIAVAIAVAVFLCSREEKRLQLPQDTSIDLALWLIPAAIIGARLYYVAFQWEMYAQNPLRILYVWEGGFDLKFPGEILYQLFRIAFQDPAHGK